MYIYIYVIVKSHYKQVVVITWLQDGAEDECNSNDNLRVQWDLTGFYPIVLMCVTICNKWSSDDNYVIAGLLSVLLTRVLAWGLQISLVAMYQKAKGKSVHIKPWCKRKSAVFTTEISLDDCNLISNEACSKKPTSVVSLTIFYSHCV